MTQEQNRKTRRAQASHQRHQPAVAGDVAAKVSQIDKNLRSLISVHQQNAQHINKAFGMQDSHIAVQYRVLNDMRKGSVIVDEDGDIALQHYHLMFMATITVAEFLMKLTVVTDVPVPADPVSSSPVGNLIPLPDFGGNHAST